MFILQTCRYFYNNGSCERQCPPYLIYEQDENIWVENPNVKYAYKTICLNECPSKSLLACLLT